MGKTRWPPLNGHGVDDKKQQQTISVNEYNCGRVDRKNRCVGRDTSKAYLFFMAHTHTHTRVLFDDSIGRNTARDGVLPRRERSVLWFFVRTCRATFNPHTNCVTSHSSNCFSSFPEFDRERRLRNFFISFRGYKKGEILGSTSAMRSAEGTFRIIGDCITFRRTLSISRKRDFRTRKQLENGK